MSGGVDSGLVAAAARKAIGLRAIGVTVQSAFTVNRDFTRAVEVAESIRLEHHPLLINIWDDDRIIQNTVDRCYYCKRKMFELMRSEYGDECVIMDGTNRDDDPLRPGLRAVKQFGVLSPLREIGLGKQRIRELARSHGLPNWDVPSESCLATRIPTDEPLSRAILDIVDKMESFYHALGVQTLRARHDNLVATIEYDVQYAEIIDKQRDNFVALIKRLGLQRVVYYERSQDVG